MSADTRASDHFPLCRLDQLAESQPRVFAIAELPGGLDAWPELDELRIAVARVGDVVYAIEDRCSHDDGPLGTGTIEEGDGRGPQIRCARHGGSFLLSSGKATRMPAITPVRSFPARVREGVVEVDLSGA